MLSIEYNCCDIVATIQNEVNYYDGTVTRAESEQMIASSDVEEIFTRLSADIQETKARVFRELVAVLIAGVSKTDHLS